ncbi:hypothetical protein [Rahnella sp. BCC 1045]|uniref:hypothetical protein n=1 Tax=Rahnella sp. BCC 1045 TaxID=2816251 RepID=UPI0020B85A0B|nr:hypothetical protein [Rahnella sp. BCC 1045]
MPITVNQDLVYVKFGMVTMSLYQRLTTLSASEESVMDNYLSKISALETAVTDSSDNLDTDQAAVWYHNKNEVNDRMKLYNLWRRQMCEFLGAAPGPSLGQGGTRLVRG